jgi:hypothetical protein
MALLFPQLPFSHDPMERKGKHHYKHVIIGLPAEAEGVRDREGSVSAAAVSLWLGSGIDSLFNRRIGSRNSASATV